MFFAVAEAEAVELAVAACCQASAWASALHLGPSKAFLTVCELGLAPKSLQQEVLRGRAPHDPQAYKS